VRTRHAVLALALAAVVSGCGGNSKHAAVEDYINRVNDVEKGMAGPIGQVTQANKDFARKQTAPGMHAQLVKSERTMRTLQRRLVATAAPAEAAQLKAMLVDLVDREVSLTHEIVQLAAFVPRYQAALKPLARANGALKTQLAATAKGAAATKALNAEKAGELDAYASTIGSVISAIEPLDPPPVWQPAYTQEVDALRQLGNASSSLARAIRGNDAVAVPKLLQRFDAAAAAGQSLADQKRQIAAVKAYDGRIRQIATLARNVQKERARLLRTNS
jgi:hypothetical protein